MGGLVERKVFRKGSRFVFHLLSVLDSCTKFLLPFANPLPSYHSSRILLIVFHSRFSIQVLKPLSRLYAAGVNYHLRPLGPPPQVLGTFPTCQPATRHQRAWKLPSAMWKQWIQRTIEEMNGLTLPRGLDSTTPGGKRSRQCGRWVWRVLGLGIQIGSERVEHDAFYVLFFSVYSRSPILETISGSRNTTICVLIENEILRARSPLQVGEARLQVDED
jgi:hypothetical protein